MTDLEELKRLAREATHGEWETEEFGSAVSVRTGRGYLVEWLNPNDSDKADAAFIAAANPAAVLALIERVERAEAQVDAASLALNRQPGETLEQAAERAMDEVAGLLERRAALETFARNFSEAVDGDLRAIEQSRKGGMQVALTGDFVSAPPSVQSRLRWWAERAKEALKEGK